MPEPVPGIEHRLAAAEATIEALHRGDADSVADAAEAALASLQNTTAALRASVSRYDTLLRFIDRGFCVVEMIFDASGEAVDYRFLETNPAFEAQTGIVGAAGRRMREIAPEHEPIWFERYGRVARTGEPAQFESVAKALGRVYEVYAYRVDEPAQAHVAILFKDITERAREAERRRQSADALQRSEERWNAALEHFGEGAIIADDHDELIYWNPAARRIHCMTEVADGLGPLASMPFELWSADGARRLDRSEWPIPRIRRGETIDRLELRLRPAAQHWERIVSYSGARVSMPSGEGLVFLSVHDLTEQRMAEGALRDSEMRFRRLADAMPQLVWTATADGTVDYYNTQVTRYTGLSENDDGTWNWHPSLHPDDEDRTVRAWRHAVASGGTYECEHRMRMSDGHFRWHLSRAHRLGPAGAQQWFGTATDVHDLKIAQERLTAADRRKDDFLAVLAHELRNPLAPLRNGLEVLRRDPSGNERARRTREMMQRQVDQMVRLLDDLLDTSRISRGKLELHREPVELAEVVRNALETSRPLLDAGNHEVQVDLPARPLVVHVDPIRVTQVLTNLLNNAAHYNAPAGRIGVSLRGEAGARRSSSSKTRVPASRPTCSSMSSSRSCSSSRSRDAGAMGASASAWPSRAASSNCMAARSAPRPGAAGAAARWRSGCPSDRRPWPPTRRRLSLAAPPPPGGCWWSTTTATRANPSAHCCSFWVTRSGSRTTVPQRSRPWRATRRTSCCSTSACPAWTATKWRAASGRCRGAPP